VTASGQRTLNNYPMPNSHDIPWKRIVVEGAAIVVSILLAFAIDAWWDERQERIEEKEILLGLRSEFSRYRDDLADGTEYHVGERLLIAELLAATRRGSWDSETLDIDLALVTVTDAKTHDFGGGILQALINAGRLEIISDYDLRIKLATWNEVFNEIRDDEIRNRYVAENLAMPYMLRWQIPQSRGLVHCCSWVNWPVSDRSIEDDPDGLSRLLADAEFEVLLALKYFAIDHILLEYETALQAMSEIIDAIDDSLSD